MSEEEQPLEFSARDLMPDWAQEKPREPQQDFAKRFAEDDGRRDRRGGGGGGRRDDRRGGGPRDGERRGNFGGRGERRDFGDRGGRFERGDRDRPRQDRPRGDRREGGGRGDRRSGPDRDRDRRDHPREERAAAGVVASIEPSGPAIEGLVRHIRETFRSFPLADLAKMILEARERYRVRFTATDPARLHQCLADGSLWLTREEAVSHLLSGPAFGVYYTAEDIQVDPPAGNFAVIAVCGMSGTVLGPPNHHEYQRNIARLHRERFSDWSLERFKSRIRMESGEEILEKWKEQVSRIRQYRVKPADEPSFEIPADEAAPAEAPEETPSEAALDEAADAPATDVETAADESPAEEPAASEESAPEATEPEAEAAVEAPAPQTVEGLVLKSMDEVARHFREHFSHEAIVETSVAVVPGNVQGRLLSHGLLAHLRQETEKLRRGFPLPLIQSLCQEFERNGLKFFKRGKKSLHVSAVRPKALDGSANLTDAIRAIVEFVKNEPKATVAGLLEALVPGFKRPEGPAIEESPEWSDAARAVLKDLRWLTAEGYILEFPDTSLAIGRQPQAAPAPAPASEKPEGKAKKGKKEKSKPAVEAPAATPVAEAVSEEVEELAAFPLLEGDPDPDDPYGLPESVDPVETF